MSFDYAALYLAEQREEAEAAASKQKQRNTSSREVDELSSRFSGASLGSQKNKKKNVAISSSDSGQDTDDYAEDADAEKRRIAAANKAAADLAAKRKKKKTEEERQRAEAAAAAAQEEADAAYARKVEEEEEEQRRDAAAAAAAEYAREEEEKKNGAAKKAASARSSKKLATKLPAVGAPELELDNNNATLIKQRLDALRSQHVLQPKTAGKAKLQVGAQAKVENDRLVKRFLAIRASLEPVPLTSEQIGKQLATAKDMMDNKKVPLDPTWVASFNEFMNRKDVREFLSLPANSLVRDMINHRIQTRIIKVKA
jgi:hypothetical protein